VARRPNFVALLLSLAIVTGGVFAVLAWRPLLPGIGLMRSDAAASAGARYPAPGDASQCGGEQQVGQGGYSFTPLCRGQAPSFDRHYYVVKNAGLGTGVGLVRGGSGESLADLGPLDRGAPFTLFWSPVDHRFFANQRPQGELERFHLFEMRGDRVVESHALAAAAREVLRTRRPCLTDGDIAVSGLRWSRDGGRIALLVYARREGCGGTGNWQLLWMIGDSRTGRIDSQSVRIRRGRAPLPADGPYATL